MILKLIWLFTNIKPDKNGVTPVTFEAWREMRFGKH